MPNADHFRLYCESLETKIKKDFECPFLKGKRKQNKLKGGIEFPSPNSLEEYRNRKEKYYKENEMPMPIGMTRPQQNSDPNNWR